MSEKFNDWVTKYQIKPTPLIHVGAHLVQEREMYRLADFEPVLWIEAQPSIFNQAQKMLQDYKNQSIVNVALWSISNLELTFYIAGIEGSSSSLLEPHLISASHPQVFTRDKYKIKTKTLDDLLLVQNSGQNYKILVLDVQGAEIEVLRGAEEALKNIDTIVSEISTLELYKGTARVKDLIKFLDSKGFLFVASEMNRATGWGEGLFIRKSSMDSGAPRGFEHIVVGKHFAPGRLLRTIMINARKILFGGKK